MSTKSHWDKIYKEKSPDEVSWTQEIPVTSIKFFERLNIDRSSPIIDIGGGTTEIAVIALGGIVCDQSLKVAGDVFTNDIIYYMRTQHNLYVGDRTAEKIKIQIGAATEDLDDPPEEMSVQGRDLLTGKPKQIEISYREIVKALEKSILRVEDSVMETLSKTPPKNDQF